MAAVVIIILLVVIAALLYANVEKKRRLIEKADRMRIIADRFDALEKEQTARLNTLRAENKEWSRQANILYGYQRGGMEAEKANDPDKAIECYKKAVEYGHSASKMQINGYYYSYERLVILYRKRKDYDSEIAFIELALSESLQSRDMIWMRDRLEKAYKLRDKSNE